MDFETKVRGSFEMRASRPSNTGCANKEANPTIAIVSAPRAAQLSAALALAKRENPSKIVLFGTGLSSTTRVDELAGLLAKDVTIVVGADDLSLLRLIPCAHSGEVCLVPQNTSADDKDRVDAVLDCLLRLPPIGGDVRDWPYHWKEHAKELLPFEWSRALWAQTTKDHAKDADKDGYVSTSPSGVLTLLMYAKVVSVAARTTSLLPLLRSIATSTPGAKEAGLFDVFPVNDNYDVHLIDFVKTYLVGDEAPWKLTRGGVEASERAGLVLERLFEHTTKMASILAASKLGMLQKNVLLIQSGRDGAVAKLLANKVPVGATGTDQKLIVTTARTKGGRAEWIAELNRQYAEVVKTLLAAEPPKASILGRLGAYAALSSSALQTDALDDTPMDALSSAAYSVVSTFPLSAAAHTSRELHITPAVLKINSTVVSAAVHGSSFACSFVTFCGNAMNSLRVEKFEHTAVANMDLVGAHNRIEAIAKALEGPSVPLGVLRGVLGGVVKMNGEMHRLAFWRKGDEPMDSFVTLLPKEYIDLTFADYATGSRNLNENELEEHLKLPFFASDTVLTLFDSSALGADVYALPSSGGELLPGEEGEFYNELEERLGDARPGRVLDTKMQKATSLFVREAANDRLSGLRIGFATRNARPKTVLVSQNTSFERLVN